MQVEVEGLVLLNDEAPKIQNLIHWVLLIASQADRLLDDLVIALEQLLTRVRVCEQLRHIKTSPSTLHIKYLCFFLRLASSLL